MAKRLGNSIFRAAIAIVAGGTCMAMTPAPAIASSAAATADVVGAAEKTDPASKPSEQRFRELFADWKSLEGDGAKTVDVGANAFANRFGSAVSVPSRMPVENARFSSNFGMRVHPVTGRRKMHKGIDIAAATGTPIYATADGTVEEAKWWGSYGNYVQIGHGAELETRYGHMSRMNVRAGQKVRKGDLIGWVGSTGRSTGPHLHYEVRIAGKAVDPEPYLSSETFGEAFAQATATGGAGGPE